MVCLIWYDVIETFCQNTFKNCGTKKVASSTHIFAGNKFEVLLFVWNNHRVIKLQCNTFYWGIILIYYALFGNNVSKLNYLN